MIRYLRRLAGSSRRQSYRYGRAAGDFQAWTSGSPRKVVTRYARKGILRRVGPLVNRIR